MAITRVTALWTGWSGAPGYTNFFFRNAADADLASSMTGAVRNFFDALSVVIPDSISIQVQQEVAVLDEATGELQEYALAENEPAVVTGDGSSAFAGPVGATITWNTETVARGRRLRGRTFIVPMGVNRYDDDGTLHDTSLVALRNAGDALTGDEVFTQLVVWSRPRDGAGGVVGDVVSYRVPDVAAVLRSRRD